MATATQEDMGALAIIFQGCTAASVLHYAELIAALHGPSPIADYDTRIQLLKIGDMICIKVEYMSVRYKDAVFKLHVH